MINRNYIRSRPFRLRPRGFVKNMLLAIDVGNTQTVMGVHEGEVLAHMWRVATNKSHTSDELRVKVLPLLDSEGIAPDDLQGAALASVVPQLTQAWCAALHRMLGIDALV